METLKQEMDLKMKLRHSELSGLTLAYFEGFNVTSSKYVKVWYHKDKDGRKVGPSYPTKTEALLDSCDYAKRAGWLKNG